MKKKVFFLSGTRADYGKIKYLIKALRDQGNFEIKIIATGMHLIPKFGNTVAEIEKDDLAKIIYIPNQTGEQAMELTLAKTIAGLSAFLDSEDADLLIVHGDRVEALAGAIVGSLRNVLTAHIEGGEVSGTIDGILRHSVSKLSHIHFVSNERAAKRLLQLGEIQESIYEIGSPDVDAMMATSLPGINNVAKRYEIPFSKYAILIFHPVTTEINEIRIQTEQLIQAVLESGDNFVVIMSNNDLGSDIINNEFSEKLVGDRFKHLPSMRFEYFLTLLKNASYIIGNSSAGVREAPYYGLPTINVGSRQRNRNDSESIVNVTANKAEILSAITSSSKVERTFSTPFGDGQSSLRFVEILNKEDFWETKKDKEFNDQEV